jgi:hypothetical protein
MIRFALGVAKIALQIGVLAVTVFFVMHYYAQHSAPSPDIAAADEAVAYTCGVIDGERKLATAIHIDISDIEVPEEAACDEVRRDVATIVPSVRGSVQCPTGQTCDARMCRLVW